MAFSFIDEKNIKDAIADSEQFMRPFFEPLAEYERLSRAKPGRIPKGKPRVTDGTLAGITRETPKQIIQQLPTGHVKVKKSPDLEDFVNGVLTDEILPNANSGGTPFSKSKNAIKDTIRNGASAAYVFYNRNGSRFSADFRRVYIKDVLFEKGKVSEFDSNFMCMNAWFTKSDLKSIIHTQQQLEKYSKERKEKFYSEWDLKLLQQLVDMGESEKDEEHKSEEEKKAAEGTSGYIKLQHVFQRGVGAKFYTWSPQLKKVVKTCVNKDPRGIMPLHILVPEEDYANPLGEPLLATSAGKQNLLDFDMQMYQYGQGLQYSPPVKKWGNVPTSSIKLVPDAVIDMGANKNQGTDIETVDISNRAIATFGQNYGLIKSQILNEMGRPTDTSISASAGNPGFSKTHKGIETLESRVSVSDNDLRKSYEAWFGRVSETMLNLHFAESAGKQELEFEIDTLKRIGKNPDELAVIDYDKDYGPIKFTVDASTSQASDNERENEKLVALLEITQKYGGLRADKQMQLVNQVIKNSGVDDPEKLTYSDDEIEKVRAAIELQETQAQATQGVMGAGVETVDDMPAEPLPGQEQLALDGVQPPLPANQPIPEQAMQMPGAPGMAPPAGGLTPEEQETAALMLERGLPEAVVAEAIVMLRNGFSDEEILNVLGGASG